MVYVINTCGYGRFGDDCYFETLRKAVILGGNTFEVAASPLKEFIQLSKWKGQTSEQAKTDLLDSEALN